MFYGADREVTGSCHGVECGGKKLLVDCGMYQGNDNGNSQDFPFDPGRIDAVVVTHAHIDHTGRLPLLVKQGFAGGIYATGATCDLMKIMLRDSAHIQEVEAGYRTRKNTRAGESGQTPMYTVEDAEAVFSHFVPLKYDEKTELYPGVQIRFRDAGHLLGSAFLEMWLEEGGAAKKVVFSGDIGNTGQPLIRDPRYIHRADVAIMESTYGDRDHEAYPDYTAELAKLIDETLGRRGNVIIPSFAVGRTQELLYFIREMKERGLVPSAPDFPVYVDSPMANAATQVYEGDIEGYMDDETVAVIKSGKQPLQFPGLTAIGTADESKALNGDRTPKVIIASSGMCDAGRIRHHLKHNLWRPECSVVFVGFQAQGTLGRILLDGKAKKVKLFGEEIAVAAEIHSFTGMSAHADRTGLLKWIHAFNEKPGRVFVVHGEDDVAQLFTDGLRQEGYDAVAPKYTAVYNVLSGETESEGTEPERKPVKVKVPGESPVFARLAAAGRRLAEVIAKNRGGANRDLQRFTDEINSLSDKWER